MHRLDLQGPADFIPWPHPACLPDAALLRQCSAATGRTGGPGGQNRNKVETLVALTHLPTGLTAEASERRSQSENRAVALRRLRLTLAVHHRAPVPIPRGLAAIDGPWSSQLWRSRTLKGRTISVNPDHHDFPALLAEALDQLAACGDEPRAAALRLGVTPTQLVRLIKDHPPALTALNERRRAGGLHLLR